MIITESSSRYPGIGSSSSTPSQNRDITLVQSVAMLIAVSTSLLNLLADFIVVLLVPKLREPA